MKVNKGLFPTRGRKGKISMKRMFEKDRQSPEREGGRKKEQVKQVEEAERGGKNRK